MEEHRKSSDETAAAMVLLGSLHTNEPQGHDEHVEFAAKQAVSITQDAIKDVEVIDVDDVEVPISPDVTEIVAETLSSMYSFVGVSEFYKLPNDSNRAKQQALLAKYRKSAEYGYSEIPLLHARNWFHDFRFSDAVEFPEEGKFKWHFGLVTIDPKAPKLHHKTSAAKAALENLSKFTKAAITFYESGFVEADTVSKTIALALKSETTIMVVAKRLNEHTKSSDFSKMNTFSVVAAITFCQRAAEDDARSIAALISWLHVAPNSSAHPTCIPGWRRRGFGLFMIICLIKNIHSAHKVTNTIQSEEQITDHPLTARKELILDIYLQCYEPSAFYFYIMLGFKNINGKYDDGFESLPPHLQTSIQETSKSFMPGESVFHYYRRCDEEANVETPALQLMHLPNGGLIHFKDMEETAQQPLQQPSSVSPSNIRQFWCQYPPPLVRGQRLHYSIQEMRDVFTKLPLLKAFLTGQYQEIVPATALPVKGSMMIERRLKHSSKEGTEWISSDEIDLMLATLLFDGRYQDSCYVLPCGFAKDIVTAFERFVKYNKAKKLFYLMKGMQEDLTIVNKAIYEKFGNSFKEIADSYGKAMNSLLKNIITRHPDMLSRKIIVFPKCEGRKGMEDDGLHWSAVFVFNASFIDEQGDDAVAGRCMRPCFFRYCSLHPEGKREVPVSFGIQYFLNLCFSYEVHRKRFSNPLLARIDMLEPFGNQEEGVFLGSKVFPALHMEESSNFFPKQSDGHNCGIGVCATVAIVLRDVLNDEEVFDESFWSKQMRLQTCSRTKEIYCDFPSVFFTPLPSQAKLTWGDYLTLLREQWFIAFDRIAQLQHETKPKSMYYDYEIMECYANNRDNILKWPNLNRKGGSPKKTTKGTSKETKLTTLQTKTQQDADVSKSTILSTPPTEDEQKQQDSNVEKIGEAPVDEAINPEVSKSTKSTRSIVEKQDTKVEASKKASLKHDTNDDLTFDSNTDDTYPKFKKPIHFEKVAIKLPTPKRKVDEVERTALDLYKRIKLKDPKDAEKFEPLKPLWTDPAPKFCSQSEAEVIAFHKKYVPTSSEIVVLDDETYKADLEAYIDKSFRDWEWHSDRAHRIWLLKQAAKMDHPTLSNKAKHAVEQVIAIVKKERVKFRKQFAAEFRFSQKTLVKGIKYVKRNNSFVARLVWKERTSEEAQLGESPEIRYIEKEEEMRVDEAWVLQEFGKKVLQHIINMRQTKQWNEVPRDVEVYIGKQKIVRVRYVPTQTRMIPDMAKLTKEGRNKPAPRSPKKPSRKDALMLTPEKLRPLKAKRLCLPLGTPPKIARKSLVDIIQDTSSEDEDKDELPEIPMIPIIISDKWIGKTEDGKDCQLEEQFIRMSYGEAFTNELKTSIRGFVDIPVGDSKPSHLHQHPELRVIGAPEIKYMQSEGKDLCVSKALASALHAFGWEKEAAEIDLFGERVLKGRVVDVLDKVKHFAYDHVLPKWLVPRMIRPSFDWNADIQPIDIFIGVLLADDGNCSHAVSIAGGFVFDANECVALPLCKESLDYCTSTETVKSTFVRFKRGYCFHYDGHKPVRLDRLKLVDIL